MEFRTVVMAGGVLLLTISAILTVLLLQVGPRGPFGLSKSISTRLYERIARDARHLGFRDAETWALGRQVDSWQSDVERHVVRGSLAKLFLRGEKRPLEDDDFLPFFRANEPTSPRIIWIVRPERLVPNEYACPASEAPSHVAYVLKEDQAPFESLLRKLSVAVVPEPVKKTKKSMEPYFHQHSMGGGSYVKASFDTILFDIIDQQQTGAHLVFQLHEVALASTPITIQLPAGLNLEETLTRLN